MTGIAVPTQDAAGRPAVSAGAAPTVAPASMVPPTRLSAAQMAASLAVVLREFGPRIPQAGIWVFGYGSLIWKPDLSFDLRVAARVFGYRRSLCLRSVSNRGTPECPGLVAGLDRGGSCAGIVYRLPRAGLRAQLERLWEREMFMGSYAPRWLAAHRLDGAGAVRALAFVVRRDATNYSATMPDAELVAVLRNARGRFGTSLDYLLETVLALRAHGLRDRHFERLAALARDAAGVEHPIYVDGT